MYLIEISGETFSIFISSNLLIMLKFYLLENPLKSNRLAPYIPKTVWQGHIDLKSFLAKASSISSVKKSDSVAVLSNFQEVLLDYLQNGYSVDLGFGVFRPFVNGSFPSENQRFVKKNLQLKIQFELNKEFQKQVVNGIRIEKIQKPLKSIKIHYLENNGKKNPEELFPNSLIVLKGVNMKFPEENPKLGLYLKPSESGKPPIRVEEYAEIKNRKIIAKLPEDLKPGRYRLFLRSNEKEMDLYLHWEFNIVRKG